MLKIETPIEAPTFNHELHDLLLTGIKDLPKKIALKKENIIEITLFVFMLYCLGMLLHPFFMYAL